MKGNVLEAKRYKLNQNERCEGKRKDKQTRGRRSCFSDSRAYNTTPWCVVRLPILRDGECRQRDGSYSDDLFYGECVQTQCFSGLWLPRRPHPSLGR